MLVKTQTTTLHQTTYAQVNFAFEKFYGREFSFDYFFENEHLLFDIEERQLDVWELEQLDDFIREGEEDGTLVETLLTDMVNKEHIAPGLYAIKVQW